MRRPTPFILIPVLAALLFLAGPTAYAPGEVSQAFAQAPGKQTPASKKVTRVKNPKKHNPTDTVGIVEGKVITYRDFNSLMSGYLRIFVKRTGDNVITDSLYSTIVDSAWNKAVEDIVIEHEIERRHLAMTDSAVKQDLIQNPPEFLKQQFTDSLGTLHREYLAQALLDPRNDSMLAEILMGERIRIEGERLVAAIASATPHCDTPAERANAYSAWLRKAVLKAKIVDKRLSFGFY